MKLKKRDILNLVLVLAVLLFISYKFYLNNMMWSGRMAPVEPDDSYSYMARAAHLLEYNSFSSKNIPAYEYEYLYAQNILTPYNYGSWTVYLALIKIITRMDIEQAYILSFYLGIIFAASVLVFFLTKIVDKLFAIISLIFLSFYWGSGTYHGFFWVVPSFYCVIMFFLIIFLLESKFRYSKLFLLLLIPIYILSHALGIVGLITILVYQVVKSVLSKKIVKEQYIKLAYILAVGFVIWLISSGIFVVGISKLTKKELPQDFAKFEREGISTLFDKNTFSLEKDISKYAYTDFDDDYLPITLLFLLGLVLLFLSAEVKLASIYIAVLIVNFLSLKNPSGYRSLVFLRPISFMVMAYCVYFVVKSYIFKKKTKTFFSDLLTNKYVLIFLIILLLPTSVAFMRSTHNYNIKEAMQRHDAKDFYWDRTCVDYLRNETSPNTTIIYENRYATSAFLAHGLFDRKVIDIGWSLRYKSNNINYLGEAIYDSYLVCQQDCGQVVNESISNVATNFKLFFKKDCGEFKIYQIKVE